MQKIKLSDEQREVIRNNNGLSRYLTALQRGRDFTKHSWLYEHESSDATLKRWMSILDSLNHGTPEEKEVYQFDTSQLKKWGPQGGVSPISELSDVYESGFKLAESPKPKAFDDIAWKSAKRYVINLLQTSGVRDLRPASYKHVLDDMRARDTLESNSGFPLFTRRNKPEIKQASIADAESGKWRDYPAIALFRNYNQKTRLVWMFPMSANLVEGSFVQPLQSRIMRLTVGESTSKVAKAKISKLADFVSPWEGFDAVRRVISRTYENPELSIAASDFSETDAHFTLFHTMEVYDVIKHCFQKQYWPGLRESLMHMHTIPLIISSESMLTGNHGVSSGSNWTNFIETIFDIIFARYVYLKEPQWRNIQGLYAIGDDMSWYGRYWDEFADYLEKVGLRAGHVIKREKTTNNRNSVKSLQRLFQRGYYSIYSEGQLRGVYSTIRALNSSLHPERFHDPRKWDSDMFCARQFMILENCVDHPLFEEFVKFVCHGQKDLIPFAKKKRGELDKILRKTKLLPGLNPTYNQEKRDHSFADFESIKLAAKL